MEDIGATAAPKSREKPKRKSRSQKRESTEGNRRAPSPIMKYIHKSLESQQYINDALDAINEGYYEEANDILEQTMQMWPESQATVIHQLLRELIAALPGAQQQQEDESTSHDYNDDNNADNNNDDTTSTQNVRGRSTTLEDEEVDNCSQTAANYTPEQLALVERVICSNNFYEVLDVSNDASNVVIRKAYKRLALQLHPDKNRAPGAIDAFKLIGSAVEVLCDEDKRSEYDNAGANMLATQGGSANSTHHSGSNTYHTQYFAQTLYNNERSNNRSLYQRLFGRTESRETRHWRTYQYANQRQPNKEYIISYSTIVKIFFLMVVSMIISSIFTSDPIYDLTQSTVYSVRRQTQRLSVPYFVQDTFEKNFDGSLDRLEHIIEDDYLLMMKFNCNRERVYRNARIARAHSFNSRTLFDAAKAIKMPSCESLSKLGMQRHLIY